MQAYFVKTLNSYNLLFCSIVFVFFGFAYVLFIFSTLGILIAYYYFRTFHKNEHYMFLNIGLSMTKLLRSLFFVNLLLAAFGLFIYFLLKP
jgi:hypothetical protein